jgi:hypothetical protein
MASSSMLVRWYHTLPSTLQDLNPEVLLFLKYTYLDTAAGSCPSPPKCNLYFKKERTNNIIRREGTIREYLAKQKRNNSTVMSIKKPVNLCSALNITRALL